MNIVAQGAHNTYFWRAYQEGDWKAILVGDIRNLGPMDHEAVNTYRDWLLKTQNND